MQEAHVETASLVAPSETRNRSDAVMRAVVVTVVLVLVEVWLVHNFNLLESGAVDKIRVWQPIATIYRTSGKYGALALLPILWAVSMVVLFVPGPQKRRLSQWITLILAGGMCFVTAAISMIAWTVAGMKGIESNLFSSMLSAGGVFSIISAVFGFVTYKCWRSQRSREELGPE